MSPESILQQAGDVNITPVGEEYIVESSIKDVFCVLNSDAFSIFRRVDGKSSVADICAHTPDPSSSLQLLEELCRLGVIQIVSDESETQSEGV